MTVRPKLLIVEDAKDLLDVWVSLLRINDRHTVKAVDQGTTALEIVKSGYHPDVLITDFYLGDVTGLELAEAIEKVVGKVEVIVATGSHDNYTLVRKAEAGEISLLIKPVRFAELSKAIDRHLQNSAGLPAMKSASGKPAG